MLWQNDEVESLEDECVVFTYIADIFLSLEVLLNTDSLRDNFRVEVLAIILTSLFLVGVL